LKKTRRPGGHVVTKTLTERRKAFLMARVIFTSLALILRCHY